MRILLFQCSHQSEICKVVFFCFSSICKVSLFLPHPHSILHRYYWCLIEVIDSLIATELAEKFWFFWFSISYLQIVLAMKSPKMTICKFKIHVQDCHVDICSICLWDDVCALCVVGVTLRKWWRRENSFMGSEVASACSKSITTGGVVPYLESNAVAKDVWSESVEKKKWQEYILTMCGMLTWFSYYSGLLSWQQEYCFCRHRILLLLASFQMHRLLFLGNLIWPQNVHNLYQYHRLQ